jgi:hypothetical protein
MLPAIAECPKNSRRDKLNLVLGSRSLIKVRLLKLDSLRKTCDSSVFSHDRASRIQTVPRPGFNFRFFHGQAAQVFQSNSAARSHPKRPPITRSQPRLQSAIIEQEQARTEPADFQVATTRSVVDLGSQSCLRACKLLLQTTQSKGSGRRTQFLSQQVLRVGSIIYHRRQAPSAGEGGRLVVRTSSFDWASENPLRTELSSPAA